MILTRRAVVSPGRVIAVVAALLLTATGCTSAERPAPAAAAATSQVPTSSLSAEPSASTTSAPAPTPSRTPAPVRTTPAPRATPKPKLAVKSVQVSGSMSSGLATANVTVKTTGYGTTKLIVHFLFNGAGGKDPVLKTFTITGTGTNTFTKKVTASGGCSPGYVFSILVLNTDSGKDANTDYINCS